MVQILARYGLPEELLTDQGSVLHVVSSLVKELYKVQHIKKLKISAFACRLVDC